MDPIKLILSFIGVLVPPDPAVTDVVPAGDPDLLKRAEKVFRELHMWRLKVSGAIFVCFCFAIWVVFGSSYANEEAVEAKIKKATVTVDSKIETMSKQMEEISTGQKKLASVINEQLAVAAADKICTMLAQLVLTSNYNDRRRLRSDIDEMQRRYKSYEGNYYPEDRCIAGT